MTVAELIERLSECDPKAEVRIMEQPNWPFEHAIRGVTDSNEIALAEADERCEEVGPEDGPSETIVYLVEGNQIRYGTNIAWKLV